MSDLRAEPVEVEGNPMPPGGEVLWLTVTARAPLRTMIWRPEAAGIENCRGTAIILNGRTEYIEKYFEVAGELIARGFAVATLDWRGQGLSHRDHKDPCCGHIEDFVVYDRDLGHFLEQVVKPSLPAPFVGLGHSMGGNLMIRALDQHRGLFKAAALSAPMFGIRFPNALAGWAALMAARIAVATGRGGAYVPGGGPEIFEGMTFDANRVTHDEERFQRSVRLREAEPGLKLGAPSLHWIQAALASCREVMKPACLSSIDVPVLIAAAEEDSLVDNDALEEAAQLLPKGRHLLIKGARHEILMERDEMRAEFWQAFDALMDEAL